MSILVSYSGMDANSVRPLLRLLEEKGIKLDLVESTNHSLGNIAKRIELADCVLVIWSSALAKSAFVSEEIELAMKAWSLDRLLLATLDDTPIPIGLRDLHLIRLDEPLDTSAGLLLIEIQKLEIRKLIPIFDAKPNIASAKIERVLPGIGSVSSDVDGVSPALPREGPSGRRKESIPHSKTDTVGAGLWISKNLILLASLVLCISVLLFIKFFLLLVWPQLSERWESPILFDIWLFILGLFGGAMLVLAALIFLERRKKPIFFREDISVNTDVPLVSPKVFISYSHLDSSVVEVLVSEIQNLGYTVWIDRECPGGGRYAAKIVKAIKSAQLVALMSSQNAFASDHVLRETYVAGEHKKPFVVFHLDSSQMPDEIVFFVTGYPRLSVGGIDPKCLQSEIAKVLRSV